MRKIEKGGERERKLERGREREKGRLCERERTKGEKEGEKGRGFFFSFSLVLGILE